MTNAVRTSGMNHFEPLASLTAKSAAFARALVQRTSSPDRGRYGLKLATKLWNSRELNTVSSRHREARKQSFQVCKPYSELSTEMRFINIAIARKYLPLSAPPDFPPPLAFSPQPVRPGWRSPAVSPLLRSACTGVIVLESPTPASVPPPRLYFCLLHPRSVLCPPRRYRLTPADRTGRVRLRPLADAGTGNSKDSIPRFSRRGDIR